jgi:hypothetical protein
VILLTPHAIRIIKLKCGFEERTYTAGERRGEKRREQTKTKTAVVRSWRNETVVGEETNDGRDGKTRNEEKKFKEDFTARPRAV